MVFLYIASWIIDFLLLVLVIAILDESFDLRVERHQGSTAFIIFFLPTLLELYFYYYHNKPFLLGF